MVLNRFAVRGTLLLICSPALFYISVSLLLARFQLSFPIFVSMEKKLFLLDALALIYRAYFALIRNPRITSKGRNTNAQFGFTNTLFELINKEKPTHLAVCFDTGVPTERHTDFADYKANRQAAPEELNDSLGDIKRIIRGFNIPVVEVDGFEADDVIGTLAWQAADAGYSVYMVTPDKDYGQLLIHPQVFIYKPGYQGSSFEILDDKKICEKWDIQRVEQVIDILGLMGDAVDNIPGIAGIGEKTAAKLLKEYDTLENVIANADNIKGSLGEKVRKGKQDAIMSKKLATIITNVPVQFHEEDYRLKGWNNGDLAEVFAELEFKSLGRRILGDEFNAFQPSQPQPLQQSLFGNVGDASELIPPSSPDDEEQSSNAVVTADKNINNTPHSYHLIDTDEKITDLLQKLSAQSEICFDTETTSIDANNAELVGMSFCWQPGEAYYVPVYEGEKTKEIIAQFKPLFDNPNLTWVGQNLKYDMLVMKWYGIELKAKIWDTMLAHNVKEPETRRGMDLLSAKYLGYEPVHIEELIGKKGKGQLNMRDVSFEKVADYAAEDADITLQLKSKFEPLLQTNSVEKVFAEAEVPLVEVLTEMEFNGVRIDEGFLKDYSVQLDMEALAAEQRIYDSSGVKFNIGSPKQLGEILFEKLNLDPKAKKTKSGQYATGEEVLVKLAQQHGIANDILIYRQLSKLKSTYVDALPLMINKKTGRVHTSYAQAVAVTGRLSSNAPNLQNIPIRTERGREIRKAFVPRDENHVLISADYSQIELRIIAAISGDANMCEAFAQNKDIHTATAAKVFHVPENEVTKEMRYKAKSVNFGIIYGQGVFGLADNLGIPRAEAKDIIDSYKKEFAGITKYMDDMVKLAQKTKYAETMMGRKRWLRDINSGNFTVRAFAERNAVNSPIQGTAADMIKLAMIKIHHAIKEKNLQSRMILQVHDELVFDALQSEVETLKPLILDNMKTALTLPNGVPVEAEVGVGVNWLEAH